MIADYRRLGWDIMVRCTCGRTARLDPRTLPDTLTRPQLLATAKCSVCGAKGAADCWPVEGGWQVRASITPR
jgi:hypothetical protein